MRTRTILIGVVAAVTLASAADEAQARKRRRVRLATRAECDLMMRNGIRLKAGKRGAFAKASPARQKQIMDKLMREPKMKKTLRMCTRKVNFAMARCIAEAENLRVYRGCAKLEKPAAAAAAAARYRRLDRQKATAAQCRLMMRNTIRIKAGKGAFSRASKRRQKQILDQQMRTPKMRKTLKWCVKNVKRRLARCIIRARTEAAFQACRKYE